MPPLRRPLDLSLVDLGKSPLCQTVLRPSGARRAGGLLSAPREGVHACWLVQIPEFVPPEDIFTEYAYFSAYSRLVGRARAQLRRDDRPASLARVRRPRRRARLERRLPPPALPAARDPRARDRSRAERRGGGGRPRRPDTRRVLRRSSSHGGWSPRSRSPRLVLGNNVLAQVPDINDFVAGVAELLAEGGTATFEFPHLATLIEHLEYDTIYHEHFSYFSLYSITRDLRLRRGSASSTSRRSRPRRLAARLLRARRRGSRRIAAPSVADLIDREDAAGLRDPETYRRFTERRRDVEARAAGAADRRAGRRARSSATERPGRATPFSTTAASGRTSSSTPSTGTRTSRASTRPGPRSRSTRRRRSPRRGRTSS